MELVHVSLIHSTTAEEYQHQSKQARSRLPHEVNNLYGGGILERCCCLQGYHVYKDAWVAVVGKVLIYMDERELTTLQYHSKCTNISYRNYFAGLIIRCKKYFAVLIIRCTKIFAKFFFIIVNDYENILIMKISRLTAHSIYMNHCPNFLWFWDNFCTVQVHVHVYSFGISHE